jgi:hypothetical protein
MVGFDLSASPPSRRMGFQAVLSVARKDASGSNAKIPLSASKRRLTSKTPRSKPIAGPEGVSFPAFRGGDYG